jgi:hypothetical protein
MSTRRPNTNTREKLANMNATAASLAKKARIEHLRDETYRFTLERLGRPEDVARRAADFVVSAVFPDPK